MSKEWKCADCCVFGTDACHFPSMEAHYMACEHLCVDHDKAYQQGRADGIDELLMKCEQYNYTLNSREFAKIIREQLKEQTE